MKKYLVIWICFTAACFSNMYSFAQHKNHDGFVNLGIGFSVPNFDITGINLDRGLSYNLNIAHPLYKNIGFIISVNGASHSINESELFLDGYHRSTGKVVVDNYNYFGYMGGVYLKGSIEQLNGYFKLQYGNHYSDLPKYEVNQTGNYRSSKYSYSSSTQGGESSGSSVVIGGGVYLTMSNKVNIHLDISWLQSKHAYKDVYIYTKYHISNISQGYGSYRSKFDVDIKTLMINIGVSYALNFVNNSKN